MTTFSGIRTRSIPTDEGGDLGGGTLTGRIARLYFERQLTKVEIAARLGISRFRVARLIEQALADGIVRIEFRDEPARDRGLERVLEERFGLDRCVVAEPSSDGVGAAARLCANLIDGLLDDGDAIGIAWGSTIARVVASMPGRRSAAIDVIQLAGNSAAMDAGTAPGDLTQAFAQRVGGRSRALHAPTFVESPSLRAALAREPDIAAAVDRFDSLSIALIGIGAFRPGAPDTVARDAVVAGDHLDAAVVRDDIGAHGPASSLVRSGALKASDIEGLLAAGAVGDLLVHPFDVDGRFVAPELSARAMAITVEQLRRIPCVVAVAAGADKTPAISGALRTGVVRILVTDSEAAACLAGNETG